MDTLASPASEIRVGDALTLARAQGETTVDCLVTSPPYWGLRDYGLPPSVFGGDPGCAHEWGEAQVTPSASRHGSDTNPGPKQTPGNAERGALPRSSWCQLCGAWRGCLGLEPHPALYLEHLLAHADEWWRVLKDTGTLWVNLGDSYGGDSPTRKRASETFSAEWDPADSAGNGGGRRTAARNGFLRKKQLLMIPARFAIGMCDRGWLLRSDIIWAKANPLPESVRDRPTRSHEYVFLFTKQERYWYDAEAIAEPVAASSLVRISQPTFDEQEGGEKDYGANGVNTNRSCRRSLENFAAKAGRTGATAFRGQGHMREGENGPANREGRDMQPIGAGVTRNSRDVWHINPKPFKEAHFAVFPEALPERCIRAGCPPMVCAECGAPYRHEVVTEYRHHENWFGDKQDARHSRGSAGNGYNEPIGRTPGPWQAACTCNAATRPGLVLDPFTGSGTTLAVARREGRRGLGFELNPEYAEMARRRIDRALIVEKAPPKQPDPSDQPTLL